MDTLKLETIIANLQDDLASCPNHRWLEDGNQYRLSLLIEYTAKLDRIRSAKGGQS